MRFFFPDTEPLPLPNGHRFPADKYHRLRHRLLEDGTLASAQLRPSPLASYEDLCAVHSQAYVEAVFEGSLEAAAQRRIGLPWSAILRDRSRATVGGTLAAANAALADGLSGQLAGGTHHAHREFGSGYCVFNDIAVAVANVRSRQKADRFAVIDLDVHQGDGNAALMAKDQDRNTFVISVHGEKNFPFRKVDSDLDIGLPDGTADAEYLDAVDMAIEAAAAHSPELLFYLSGVDPLREDRLGRLDVSAEGLAERDRRVLSWAREAGIPIVIVIGGGYADPVSLSVDAYARTFEQARSIFRW